MSKVINMKTKAEENFVPPKKGIFILLLILTSILVITIACILWWVPYVGMKNISKYLPWISGIILGSVVLYGIAGTLALLLTIIKKKNLFISKKTRGMLIKLLFPVLIGVGKLIGISVDEVRKSFIAVNNELVMAEAKKIKPHKLLLLLPHCLQNHECKVRIIGDINNCKRCGKCKIKSLIELAERYNIHIAVATGGTLARKIVKETKPDAIVAVACERDLTSGIQDTYPIPVFGVFNRRPNGPCYDTDVDLELVKKGIEFFLNHEAKEKYKTKKYSTQDSKQANS